MAHYWTDLKTAQPGVSVIVTETDRDGTIRAVGGPELLQDRKPDDEVESLAGAFVSPGFWDSHVHLVDYGLSLGSLAFDSQASLSDVLAQVAAHARGLDPGQALTGRGWNGEALGALPSRALLDAAAAGHPAVLMSLDYHTVWVNAAAIDRLDLPDSVRRSALATGLVRETAAFAVQQQAQAWGTPNLEGALRQLARFGLTGVTAIEDQLGAGRLATRLRNHAPLRAQVLLRAADWPTEGRPWPSQLEPSPYCRVIGVKLFSDGALGSHTAWMVEPYQEEPDNYGMPLLTEAELTKWAKRLRSEGAHLAIHAIGDRAVNAVSTVLCAVWGQAGGARIEHAQLIDDADLTRLAHSGVGLSMQPVHLLVDRPLAERHWGARSARAFRFRDVLDQGIGLAFGSDAPVASPDPRLGLWAAVHRALPGEASWYPEQRLSPDAAIFAYTRGPALLDGRPSGAIRAGFWGDFTLWREDPRVGLAQKEFDRLEVVGTIVGGIRVKPRH